MKQRRVSRLASLFGASTMSAVVAVFAAKALTVAIAGKPLADVLLYAIAGAALWPLALAGALQYHEEVRELRREREEGRAP